MKFAESYTTGEAQKGKEGGISSASPQHSSESSSSCLNQLTAGGIELWTDTLTQRQRIPTIAEPSPILLPIIKLPKEAVTSQSLLIPRDLRQRRDTELTTTDEEGKIKTKSSLLVDISPTVRQPSSIFSLSNMIPSLLFKHFFYFQMNNIKVAATLGPLADSGQDDTGYRRFKIPSKRRIEQNDSSSSTTTNKRPKSDAQRGRLHVDRTSDSPFPRQAFEFLDPDDWSALPAPPLGPFSPSKSPAAITNESIRPSSERRWSFLHQVGLPYNTVAPVSQSNKLLLLFFQVALNPTSPTTSSFPSSPTSPTTPSSSTSPTTSSIPSIPSIPWSPTSETEMDFYGAVQCQQSMVYSVLPTQVF